MLVAAVVALVAVVAAMMAMALAGAEVVAAAVSLLVTF